MLIFREVDLIASMLLALCYSGGHVDGAHDIKLIDNGYEGIVVAISDCVDEKTYPNIIDNIKRLFSQFSSSLYVATENRAFVRHVTILVPASWDNKGYGVAQGESLSNAAFRVDEENPMFGVQPYAVEDPPELQCVHQWDHIHLSPEYVTNFRTYKDNLGRYPTDCLTSCSQVPEQLLAHIFPSCRSCTEFAQCSSRTSEISYVQCSNGTSFDPTVAPSGACVKSSRTCGVMELVHEWGHFRWALGDEHPHEGDQLWYMWDESLEIREGFTQTTDHINVFPNRCSHQLTFDRPECSISDIENEAWEECAFESSTITDPSRSISVGSVMFDLNAKDLDHANKFCGYNPSSPESGFSNHPHNKVSRNDHNRRCNDKSSWEVMSMHSDFKNGANLYRIEIETQPDFKIVQQRSDRTRVVLVLDVSGSMTSRNERGTLLQNMNQDAASYISSAPDGSNIGIVSFSSSANTLHEIAITPEYTSSLTGSLPAHASGGTCISCGIRRGMDKLNGFDKNTAGGRILIITDGMHNTGPAIDSVNDELVESGIHVDSILYTVNADLAVRQISEITGGSSFSDDGNANSTVMIQALLDLLTDQHEACSSFVNVPVLTEAATLQRNVETVLQAVVDSSVGHNTRFSFTHPPSLSNPLSVTLVDPTGNQFTSNVMATHILGPDESKIKSGTVITEHDQILGTLTMTIVGQADFGRWTIRMSNTHNSQTFSSQVLVTSTPASPDLHPIAASATLLGTNIDLISDDHNQRTVRIFCTVRQGHAPILDASVIAVVDSSYEDFTVILKDNGQGIDAVANDGVYSAPFVQFTRNGRFAVSVEARNPENTASVVTGPYGKRVKRDTMTTSSVGLFERVSAAGFFTVEGHTEAPGKVPNVVPPARVNDLRFVRASEDEKTIEIRWTAVGNDLFDGTASSYELRYSIDFDHILNDFESCLKVSEGSLVTGSLSNPAPSGVRETLIFSIVKEQLNKTENYALRVYDDGGLYSDISNIVRVFVPAAIPMDDPTTEAPPPPPPTPSQPGTTTTPRPPRTSAPVTEAPEESSEPNLALIIGSVCAVLLTGLLIAVIILIIRVQKAGKSKSKPGLLSEFSSQASDSVSKGTGSRSLPSPPATYPGYTSQVMMAPPEYPPQLHSSQLHSSQVHPTQLHPAQLHPSQLHPAQLYSSQVHPSLLSPVYQGETNQGYEYGKGQTYANADLMASHQDMIASHPQIIPRASVSSSRGHASPGLPTKYDYRY